MTNILNVAVSGLNAFQRGIDVSGNNIANSHTEGYSRQTIQLKSVSSQRYAGSFIGGGVVIDSIKRNSDRFATQQVRDTLTVKSQFDTFYQQAIQVDRLLSQQSSSISGSMQNFFNAMSQLNEAPDSISVRGVAFTQSKLLVEQYQSMQRNLDEYQHNNTEQLHAAVVEVNRLTEAIAAVNAKLTTMQNAPDLLDNRDALLKELSKYTEVTVVDQGDQGITVGIGNGEVLVAGTRQRQLVVLEPTSENSSPRLGIKDGATLIDVSNNLGSGSLGAMLDFQQNILNKASQILGQMAVGLSLAFNQQHQIGMDMNDQIGKSFFTDFNSTAMSLARSSPTAGNSGTGVFSVNISDMAQTKASDYQIIISDTGSNELRVIRESDGQSMLINWTDSPPTPPAAQFQIDGMTITLDDVANFTNGDTYTISPFKGAARELVLNINDGRELAMAAPVRTSAPLSNMGNGDVKLGSVFDTSAVNKNFRVEFTSPTQFNLVNVTDSVTTGPFVFTPNAENTILIPDGSNPSFSIVVSGIPQTGDVFNTEFNAGGYGDNRNGLQLNAIQQLKSFDGGKQTVFDLYSNVITEVGSKTSQAKLRGEAADILHNQAVDFRESKSGVDLDEEAANLLYFQKAYQAAGKLLAISSEMMDYLFAVMR